MENRLTRLITLMEDSPRKEFMEHALKAALSGGAILRELYSNAHEIRYKGRIDLVTEADIASEKRVLEILQAETEIPVMAEESGISQGSDRGRVWIVDPLDGTTNFAHGFQVFAVSIALAAREGDRLVPEAGVVYCPMQDELFWGVKGGGAWLENCRLQVSTEKEFARSLIGTGFPYAIKEKVEEVMESLRQVVLKAQGVRRAGAAAVDLAWVAAGRLDGFYEIDLKPWDTAAGALLVQEAGGRVTDFLQMDFHPEMNQTLASNGLIHAELASLMKV